VATPGNKVDLALIKRPAWAAVLALVLGMVVGPVGLQLLRPELMEDGVSIESVTETALLVCLFGAGLRLRIPFEWRVWRTPLRLSSLTLLATVALTAAAAHLVFDMSLAHSLLLGVIVSPTDSVLTSEVNVHPEDNEDSSFVLSAESGINNGVAAALVLVVLGMMGLSDSDSAALGTHALTALWTIGGGFGAGWLIGAAMARWIFLLDPERQADFLEEVMVFAAAVLAYGGALVIHASAFLALFAAGVALCHGGRLRRPLRNRPLMPRVLRIAARIEWLAWLLTLVLLGALVAGVELRLRMLVFALVLLLLIRPVAVRLGLGSLAVPETHWRGVAWFPARGLACLYCLSFALNQGLSAPYARQLTGAALVVAICSVLASAVSGIPLGRASAGTVDL
jgi:NhaP-type Na+/H+ or K+/H+ antiporter